MAPSVTPSVTPGNTLLMTESGLWLSSQFQCCCPAEGGIGSHWKATGSPEKRRQVLSEFRPKVENEPDYSSLVATSVGNLASGCRWSVVERRSLRWWRRCERLESERRQQVTLNAGAWDVGHASTPRRSLVFKAQTSQKWTGSGRSFIIFRRGPRSR